MSEAEAFATDILTTVSPAAIAAEVAFALLEIPTDHLAARAGRHRGGYIEANEAAWSLVEGACEPFIADLRRLATLGHRQAATATVVGILTGLRQLGTPEDGTVLAYAGPDTVDALAEAVHGEAAKHSLELPDEVELEA